MSEVLFPLLIRGECVASDGELFNNMEAAIARGYPEIDQMLELRDGSIAIAASGPSLKDELETLRRLQSEGIPVVAVRDAHDFLIANDIIPDYGFTVDPVAESWHCFERKDPRVEYIIASQCNPAMFDHLADQRVKIFHLYMKAYQDRPKNRMLIGGGSTSGSRAIFLFYVLGYRNFHLFGFDSCLRDGILRVNGAKPKEDAKIIDIRLSESGEVFHCNLAMAQQAHQFEELHYQLLQGTSFKSYGHGLITAIIEQREAIAREIEAITPQAVNERVSFIHRGGPDMASFRYRAAIPAREMGANINDLTAGTLIFSKPLPGELMEMGRAKARGQRVIVDFCDDHFEWAHYKEALRMADLVVCNTPVMAEIIQKLGKAAAVIPDPYEFPLATPHCGGTRLLWYGHQTNRGGLEGLLPDIRPYPLVVVSNFTGAIPWSHETMRHAFAGSDIVILPKTEDYKSANRAVEAIRQGCFVVAEPHPALSEIPGIWQGNIPEGIEWVKRNTLEANRRLALAQDYVTAKFSLKTVIAMWKSIIQLPTTLGAVAPAGQDGSTWTAARERMYMPIFASSPLSPIPPTP